MRRHVCMNTGELLAVLDDIRARVEAGDSFEGSFEYLMPGPLAHEVRQAVTDMADGRPGADVQVAAELRAEADELDAAEFAVMASYRIGNTMGQGGVRLISREGRALRQCQPSGDE